MQTNNETRTGSMLSELASDYSSYLMVDATPEWNKLSGSIRSLSANVDEFSTLLDSISLDISLCVDNLLPQIVARYEQLENTFKQVDILEKAVKTVEKSVTAMEAEVDRAESQLGTESVFKSVLRPFLKAANAGPSQVTPPVYRAVDIYNSDELWEQPES